ncbi:metalloregulator ArsR/SmtB family transcription factor [Desulfonatronospira sp.]|uniref:ArsR/SmtB family transcription factor n=2 Tax=Desulfonatronospira sp. TaxID=1962951 RepID=UPI0025C0CDF3|nr:metalloregulator ArsR/SmtB family transcription factor [Desulfonatronospira sp.]
MVETIETKDRIYEQLARVGKAISSPKRLELLDLLRQGPRSVEALAGESGLSVANASRHLQVLRQAQLVEVEKQGKQVVYSVGDQKVCEFFQTMCSLAEARLADFERLMRKVAEKDPYLEEVDRSLLMQRAREGSITVLDVRPAQEYAAGHIPGAVSVPLNELEERIQEISPENKIVAYCRGPYCLLASRAVEFLRSRGFEAVRIRDGVHEWKMHGLQLEK